MRNTKRQGMLLGAGLLGVSAFGIAQPVLAQSRADVRAERRDVKEARKEVKQERKDVRKADTRGELRQESRQLTAAQLKLQRQREQLRREQQQRLQQQQLRQGYRPPVYSNRPGYSNRPAFQNRPIYQNRDLRTVEGIVVSDLSGNAFLLRTINGQQLRVQVPGGEPRRISRGDRVRVYGTLFNGALRAESLTLVRDR
ncbi:MAG TPA: hypothetical protein VF600_07275 [Abditibacteriaceae bacterium]|jgi:translation initiation factor IF-1